MACVDRTPLNGLFGIYRAASEFAAAEGFRKLNFARLQAMNAGRLSLSA